MSVLRSPLALDASRQILDALDRAPRPVAELPRRWPVTRALVRVCLDDLVARGEVRIEGTGARRMARRLPAPETASTPAAPEPSREGLRRTAA
jgi:hypothetical protein